MIKLTSPNIEYTAEVRAWCEETFGPSSRSTWQIVPSGPVIDPTTFIHQFRLFCNFASEKDGLLFMLRWEHELL